MIRVAKCTGSWGFGDGMADRVSVPFPTLLLPLWVWMALEIRPVERAQAMLNGCVVWLAAVDGAKWYNEKNYY